MVDEETYMRLMKTFMEELKVSVESEGLNPDPWSRCEVMDLNLTKYRKPERVVGVCNAQCYNSRSATKY